MRSVLISTGPDVGLERHGVVGDALEQAGQLVAVVQEQAVGFAGSARGRGDRDSRVVAVWPVGRRVEDDAGERFQRQLQRSEQIGIGGEPVLVGGDDFGRQAGCRRPTRAPLPCPAPGIVPSGPDRPPAWLCCWPATAKVSCHLASTATSSARNGSPSTGTASGDSARAGEESKNANCKMQIAKCKLQIEN